MKVTIQDRTLVFSIEVVRLIRQLPRSVESDILRKQIIRSSTSIGANIREAQSGSSKREFLQYMQIALRSARETEYWLEILSQLELLSIEPSMKLLQENQEISRILTAILRTGKRNS